ncbi:MAG: hypothetical protein HNEKOMLI_00638 [Sodalis sp. Psp]|nr:hypothetical protein [Sodalis sp. Psp]MCR3757104.1 hypothetical protein [Sodalis sp. Ppy]
MQSYSCTLNNKFYLASDFLSPWVEVFKVDGSAKNDATGRKLSYVSVICTLIYPHSSVIFLLKLLRLYFIRDVLFFYLLNSTCGTR